VTILSGKPIALSPNCNVLRVGQRPRSEVDATGTISTLLRRHWGRNTGQHRAIRRREGREGRLSTQEMHPCAGSSNVQRITRNETLGQRFESARRLPFFIREVKNVAVLGSLPLDTTRARNASLVGKQQHVGPSKWSEAPPEGYGPRRTPLDGVYALRVAP
jgi:hypothetical protein